jgi:hypothetical protein
LNKQHFCPVCLETRRDRNQLPELVSRRVLYDGAALLLAVATWVLFVCVWFTYIVAGPLAIWLAIMSWFKPGSLIPRTKARAVLAIFLGLLQIAAFFAMIRFYYLALGGRWQPG